MRKIVVALYLVFSGASVGFAQSASVQRIAYDYTAMYEAISPSIVKVHTDSGSGSGFLVHDSGMFATNHHVVRNARYVAVEFTDGRKVAAEIVLLDARNDVAILKVNRQTLRTIKALPLLADGEDGTVKAGIPVVAFGSPLSQTFLMTQGIVSKVEPGVVLGDFLIEPGNSGGPLVNLQGAVIGINTFGERRISGAVRVNLLRDALKSPAVSGYSGPEPDSSELPTADRVRYPTDLLKTKVMSEPLDVSVYSMDGGRFTITAVTPVFIGKAQVQSDLKQASNRYSRRGKKIRDEKYDPTDEPFYDWVRNAAGYMDSLVTFEVKPDFGATTGSIWAAALAGASAGLSGTAPAVTRQTMEFKAEFEEMKLFRDGELIQPVTPGRQITERSLDNGAFSFVDEAYSGMYQYHPSVFMTGKSFRLDIYDAREPGKVHKSLQLAESSKLIQQLRNDFKGVIQPR